MIVEALISLARGIVSTVLSWLPDIDPPNMSGAVAALTPMWSYLGWANKYVPLVEVAAMFTLLATVQMVLYLIQFGQWIASKIRLLGGS